MSAADRPKGHFREIPIQLIDDPALPSRGDMDDEKMAALVSSVRENGIIQPVSLVQRGERFEVVAGHRRTIAARRAGLPLVPATVYPDNHPALRVIQAHENGRREDVNAVDEAVWFAELLEQECGDDIDKLCGLVGETLSYVNGRLELLALDEPIRDALRAGKIKIGVARELQKCADPKYRAYYLEHAIRGGATVAVVVAWVTEWRNIFGTAQPPAAESSAPIEPSIVEHYDPHRCYICRKSDHRYIPEQISVHTHCRLAVLDELLQHAANDEAFAAQSTDPRRI